MIDQTVGKKSKENKIFDHLCKKGKKNKSICFLNFLFVCPLLYDFFKQLHTHTYNTLVLSRRGSNLIESAYIISSIPYLFIFAHSLHLTLTLAAHQFHSFNWQSYTILFQFELSSLFSIYFDHHLKSFDFDFSHWIWQRKICLYFVNADVWNQKCVRVNMYVCSLSILL